VCGCPGRSHEIPLISVRVVQHDMHAARCRCGAVHEAAPPDGLVAAPVSYGVNLRAWCVYLMVVHAVPIQRCGQIVESPAPSRAPGSCTV